MMKRSLIFAAALLAASAFTAQAEAQTLMPPPTGEERVPFDNVPAAVQNSLTNYSSGESSGAAATVWERVTGGHTLYRGRIVDVDGSARVIDIDPTGRVEGLHQFAPPLAKAFDPGTAVAWHALPASVRKTIQGNTSGLPITTIVRKSAANGMPIYVATTTDATGALIYIETTANGSLIGVKRRPD
jgi:hypothetical protein